MVVLTVLGCVVAVPLDPCMPPLAGGAELAVALLIAVMRVAVSDVVQRLKGASAHAMRAAVPQAFGRLWQTGYWAESVGPFELAAVVAYVRDQRRHHDGSELSERWEAGVP